MTQTETDFERANALVNRIQTYCSMTKRHVNDPMLTTLEKIEELCSALRITVANIKRDTTPKHPY